MKLSIVMIVKNEGKHLNNCLESLNQIRKEIDSELIILDTGSTDNTVEIAKKYTNNVYYKEWNNDFAEMRNIALSHAKGEWILSIDGDEVVEDSGDIIDFFISDRIKGYNSATVRINNISGVEVISTLNQLRLFKNNKNFKYIGAIHEQPMAELPTAHLNSLLLHFGYDATDIELNERKYKRNKEILLKELQRDPENVYYWFQLAQSYCSNDEYGEGLEAALKAVILGKKKGINERDLIFIYIYILKIYTWMEQYSEVEKRAKDLLKITTEHLDVYYLLGCAQQSLLNYDDAIKSFDKYLDMVTHYEDFEGYHDASVDTMSIDFYDKVIANISLIYYKKDNFKMAVEYGLKITDSKFISDTLYYIIDSFVKLKDFKGLKLYYDLIEKDIKLKQAFGSYLEKAKAGLSWDDKTVLFNDYSRGEDIYSILNRVRLEDLNGISTINEELLELIKNFDFNSLSDEYADIIYYLVKREYRVEDLLANTNLKRVEGYLNYLINEYSGDYIKLAKKLIYGANSNALEFNSLRLYRVIAKTLIISEQLIGTDLTEIVKFYIEVSTVYIERTVNSTIIENEMIYDAPDDESAFIITLINAKKHQNNNVGIYTTYLQKALRLYPTMKRVIQVLNNESKVAGGSQEQLDNSKKIFKDQIKDLIERGNLQEAYKVIEYYEKLITDDFDINSYKLIIAIMINDIELAEFFLTKGLSMDSENIDLLYNGGYIYSLKNDYEKSLCYYSKAFEATDDEALKQEIESAINVLKTKKEESTSQNKEIDKALEDSKLKLRENIEKLKALKK